MLLRKKSPNTPSQPRSDVSQITAAGATTGQRVLAWGIAIATAFAIGGVIIYKIIWPAINGEKQVAPPPPQKEKTEHKEPNLLLPSDERLAPVAIPNESSPTPNSQAYPQGRSCPPGLPGCEVQAINGAPASAVNTTQALSPNEQVVDEKDLAKQQAMMQMRADAEKRKYTANFGSSDSDQASAQPVAVAPTLPTRSGTPTTNATTEAMLNALHGNQQNKDSLESKLVPISTPATSASYVKNRSLILGKGTPITCTGDAIDTTQPGTGSCLTDFPIYSMDGKVVLMERGTKINFEYQTGISQGQSAAFVLFTGIETPMGVRAALNSPGTDQLGRAGIHGEVDEKFWDRFKGAIMFSILTDSIAALETRASSSGSGNSSGGVYLLPQTTQTSTNAIGDILKQGSEIRPSLNNHQGAVLGITVARDVDFSTVYRLAPVRQ